nr:MAG TPA: hypothetical protein [Caudoviricetes sp.]
MLLGRLLGFSLIVRFDGGIVFDNVLSRKNRSATLGIFFLRV